MAALMAQAKTSAARHVPVRSGSGSRDAGVLGTSVRIRGKISGEGDLQILGTVEGDVVVRGDLMIGESAHIETENLEAQAVTIQGEVKGDVNATGPVRLGRTARSCRAARASSATSRPRASRSPTAPTSRATSTWMCDGCSFRQRDNHRP